MEALALVSVAEILFLQIVHRYLLGDIGFKDSRTVDDRRCTTLIKLVLPYLTALQIIHPRGRRHICTVVVQIQRIHIHGFQIDQIAGYQRLRLCRVIA